MRNYITGFNPTSEKRKLPQIDKHNPPLPFRRTRVTGFSPFSIHIEKCYSPINPTCKLIQTPKTVQKIHIKISPPLVYKRKSGVFEHRLWGVLIDLSVRILTSSGEKKKKKKTTS